MRFFAFTDDWPVETWVATCAAAVLRLRRRIWRRPALTALAAALPIFGGVIVGNALWQQREVHPAPFWGERPQLARVSEVSPPPFPEPAPREEPYSPLVAEIQAALLDGGTHDGVLDRRTAAAIERFEAANGLTVTGRPSVALLTALRKEQPTSGHPGSAGRTLDGIDVAALQGLLNENGYGPLEVDGVLGPRTREALSRFAGTAEGRSALTPPALELVGSDA